MGAETFYMQDIGKYMPIEKPRYHFLRNLRMQERQ